MILAFYNLALLLALLVSTPWWLWKIATTHKYRKGLWRRLGHVPAALRDSMADQKPAIWLHAVSVGEVLAVSRLVAEFDRTFPQYRLLLSTTTRTGQDLATQRFGADRVLYCPLDLPWAVRAYFRAIRPRIFILAETEFWPNMLSAAFRRGIPVIVVNARISDRSWPRYHRIRWLWAHFLGRLARVLAQSETDASRLLALGCEPQRVTVAGNLKFDVRAAEESEATRLLKAARNGLRFVVAGSTLEGEETALIDAWPTLLSANRNLVMILAPRHPERFDAVAALLDKSQRTWTRRSQWTGGLPSLRAGQVVLLDSIGELASVYCLASIAFVGGSLVPAGGHNPLEPAQFGVPIVIGPHYANFRAITEDLLDHEALRITQPEDLAATMIDMLRNPDAAEATGVRALEIFEEQAGATARCMDAIREVLDEDSRWAQP